MKCRNHPEIEAISACRQCGSGVCKKCAEKTDFLPSRYRFICADCYRELCAHGVTISQSTFYNSLIHLFINIVLLVIGMIIARSQLFGDDVYIQNIAVGFIIAGAYGFIDNIPSEQAKLRRRKAKYGSKHIEYIDQRNQVLLYMKYRNIVLRLFALLISLVFAPLITLLRIAMYASRVYYSSYNKIFWKYELAHVYDA